MAGKGKLLMPKGFKQSPLLRGSLVLFAGTTVANFGNYLYHLLMGRMLGPKDYGALTSLISLAYLLSVISATLSTSVVKFATRFKAKNDYTRLFWFVWRLMGFFLLFGLVILAFFFVAKSQIGRFLRLNNAQPVVLVGVWMFVSFLSFINEGILRAFFRFGFLSFNAVLATLLKVGLAVALVRAGWGVVGAVMGIALGSVLPYFFSFYPLRFLWRYNKGEEKVAWGGFVKYTLPVLVATLGLTSLYSTDVILARHFLPSLESGLYAALATMGKIVFFASGVIPMVMFPLVAERHEKREKHREIVDQSILLVVGESFLVTLGYFIFSRPMINLLYGSRYVVAAPFLGWFAIFISLYSLSNLLVNFFLSVGRVWVGWLALAAAGLQVVLLWRCHQSIGQMIQVSLGVSALLLVTLLLCFRKYESKK